MIRLEKVTKSYKTSGRSKQILKSVNLSIRPGERVGILGRNGAGKSTLIRLVSGVERPTSGNIHRKMSISWPLAFGGTFLGMLTGYDNFRFICRLYNVDPKEKVDFVKDFAELGRYFYEPLKTYSSGMRARLAFAISMAVEFDCFLIDEIIAVGDSRFQQKCNDELFVKRADRAFLIVSHHADFIRDHCTSAAVLEDGSLTSFQTLDEAYHAYNAHLADTQLRAGLNSTAEETLLTSTFQDDAEVDRREAMIEEQIASLANFMIQSQSKGLDDETLAAFIRALSNENLEISVFIGVVDRLKLNGHLEAATRFAVLASAMYEHTGLYNVVVGDLYFQQRKDKQAIDAYRRATEVESDSYWGHRNLGIALFGIGDYETALPHFHAALDIGGDVSQKRELVRYIIDSHTYLEMPVPEGLIGKVELPSSEISEITCVHYSRANIANVRVMGFVDQTDAGVSRSLRLAVGGTIYEPVWTCQATNSYRRYAELTGHETFSAEFSVPASSPLEHAAVELWLDGKKRASEPCAFRMSDSAIAIEGLSRDLSPGEISDLCYQSHNYELCVTFGLIGYGSGEIVDVEALAESLIALGRFHEAETFLAEWFTSAPLEKQASDKAARLFDLLCVEIARSRLADWQERLQKIVQQRLSLFPRDASAKANQGHLQVLAAQFTDATESYNKAALAAEGRELIHFSRGIFSAQFADFSNTTPSFEKPDPSAPSSNKLLHLISCDAKYFKRYGPAVIPSSRNAPGAESTFLHVHITDPDIECLDLIGELQKQHSFRASSEFLPFDNVSRELRLAYYTSARFINAASLMAIYNAPVLITETDCLINWSWDEIRNWTSGADFGCVQSALWNLVPWTKIPAGIIYFANNTAGIAIANEIRNFLIRIFSDKGVHKMDLWTIDQVSLWVAWEKFKNHINSIHLPMTSMLELATGDKNNIFI